MEIVLGVTSLILFVVLVGALLEIREERTRVRHLSRFGAKLGKRVVRAEAREQEAVGLVGLLKDRLEGCKSQLCTKDKAIEELGEQLWEQAGKSEQLQERLEVHTAWAKQMQAASLKASKTLEKLNGEYSKEA